MTQSQPAVSKSSGMFVIGLAVGLVVGGLAGVYVGAFTDSGSIPRVKPVSGTPSAPPRTRDDTPGSAAPTGAGQPEVPGSPGSIPETPKPEEPK